MSKKEMPETTFRQWLEEVCIDQNEVPLRNLLLLMTEDIGANEFCDLIEPFLNTIFLYAFCAAWRAYQSYRHMEPSIRARWADTATRKVADLPGGFSLWRCTNGGGVPYSFIRSQSGVEVWSNPREKEEIMLQHFEENLPMLDRTWNRE